MEENNTVIGSTSGTHQNESPEQLEAMIASYSSYVSTSEDRKRRCADLMQRPGAKKWSPAKKARMARRYFEATRGAEVANEQISLLNTRLNLLDR